MAMRNTFGPARIKRIGWGIPVAVALLGATMSVSAAQGSLPWIGNSPAAPGPSKLASLSAETRPTIRSLESNGFRVDLQAGAESDSGELVVYYKVQVADARGFGDMLGIPRVMNRDGSIVLPSEYGTVGAVSGFEGGIKGLPSGASGAIFDRAKVGDGAVIRFGPFFRSADTGVTVTASGQALADGVNAAIGGEPFTVSAITNKDGTVAIEFVNTAANATVVASHPGSTVTVTVDGKAVDVVRGSTNFAKTAGYDVNANRSAVVVASAIPAGAEVTIEISSTGAVYRGNWDFPIK